jgi:hypothetical protein
MAWSSISRLSWSVSLQSAMAVWECRGEWARLNRPSPCAAWEQAQEDVVTGRLRRCHAKQAYRTELGGRQTGSSPAQAKLNPTTELRQRARQSLAAAVRTLVVGEQTLSFVRCTPFCKVNRPYWAYQAAQDTRCAHAILCVNPFVLLIMRVKSITYFVSWRREGDSNPR